jgi:hypothetical protein
MSSNGPDPFDGLRPARAPEALRERVLDAARQAMLEAPAPTIWDRLFESRALRTAWGALCLILVAGHLVLTEDPQSEGLESRSLVDAPELKDVLELPRLDEGILRSGSFGSEPAPAPKKKGASSAEGVPS